MNFFRTIYYYYNFFFNRCFILFLAYSIDGVDQTKDARFPSFSHVVRPLSGQFGQRSPQFLPNILSFTFNRPVIDHENGAIQFQEDRYRPDCKGN